MNDRHAGTLWVVATPIGNLGDLSPRAQGVLRGVALIAAEDTRHSRPLLEHFGIAAPLTALHEHNERAAVASLLAGARRACGGREGVAGARRVRRDRGVVGGRPAQRPFRVRGLSSAETGRAACASARTGG